MKNKKVIEFESGHPDLKPAPSAGFFKTNLAHFGALEKHDNLILRGESLNQIHEKMIKSVVVKDFDGNISKRWYVEYREYNSLTKQWVRHREYGFVNKKKDLQERRNAIQALSAEILTSLGSRIAEMKIHGDITIKIRIDEYLADKENSLRDISNYRLTLKYFWSFLKSVKLDHVEIHEIQRTAIHEFRKYLSKRTGNRSVYNHMGFLKAFFNYYKKNYNDVVLYNPVDGVENPSIDSETHVAYTAQEQLDIFAHLAEHDQKLLLYCQFVGMGFLRCKELRYLKVGDIDFINRSIIVTAGKGKTKKRKVKPMMNVFYEILVAAGIDKYPTHFYVFTIKDNPGLDHVHENYFQKRFQPIKKKFKLSHKHTLYSFRHTFVCKLLRNGAKWHEVMKYTGHTTMEAFAKYARALMDEPAEDMSKYLN